MSVLQDRCAPEFRALLDEAVLGAAESNEQSCYGVWADGRLAYLNPGWFRFAERNDALEAIEPWGLGVDAFGAMAPSVRGFYREAYTRVADGGRPWGFEYECSSDERYRRFHMHVYPVGEGRALLTTNSLVVERAHDPVERPPCAAVAERYTNADGMIVQCAFCRRTQRPTEPVQWDWVAEWVCDVPLCVSGGICPNCHTAHFGPEAVARRRAARAACGGR